MERVETGVVPRSQGGGKPVCVPEDVDNPKLKKADGLVTLPLHVQWSGNPTYDLNDPHQRARAYEQVLREGHR